jgi:hypothetical protein
MDRSRLSGNNHIQDWTDLICNLSHHGYSVSIGIFNTEGQLLEANPALCYFGDTNRRKQEPKNFFINPEFSFFLSDKNDELTFEGFMTVENYADAIQAVDDEEKVSPNGLKG